MSKFKVGIVGCGNIGNYLAKFLDREEYFELKALADIDRERARNLANLLSSQPSVVSNLELVDLVDLTIESACPQVVPGLVRNTILKKRNILVLSVGGLVSEPDLLDLIRKNKETQVYIPSGAIAGLDAVKAAAASGGIKKVTLTTTKPPKGLEGAPYIKDKNIDLFRINVPTVIFEGTAREAINAFPKNINVAISLSIAGIGPDMTIVKIVANPNTDVNSHEITVEGDFGKIETRTENVPCPFNPRSSYLAVLSTIALLKGMTSSLKLCY
ncbi:MAG: aspartate dehydrogenase [bacterium]